MTKLDLAGKTGPELVAMNNEMVLTADDLGVAGFSVTKRFANLDVAMSRIQKLHDAIEAARGQTGQGQEVPASETAPATAEEEQAADTAAEASDGETAQGEEEQDMAKKAKAKTKKVKAPKKAGGGARAKSTSGTTIREMTEEYNAVVAKMNKGQKEAAPFAKHHNSMFETKEKAKKQLDRLKKAIAKA